jgi:gas vesicle protein
MRLLSGIITVALAGIIAGILLAPEQGEKTRKKLNQEGGRFRSDLEKQINEGIYQLLDTISELLDDYAKRSQKSLKEAKKRKKFVNL